MTKNDKCAVSDSPLCRWIDKDCADCHINGFKHDDDVKKAAEDFEVTLSLLPDDVDVLMGDECQFCKGEKRARAGYALIDLAHPEPKSETGMFFGLGKKIRRKVGSIMPLSISICSECRKAFILTDIIKWICTAAGLGISAAVLLAFPLPASVNQAITLGIVVVATLAGYLIGKAASAAYVRAKSRDVRFNVFDIPICAEMKEAGWFTVQDDTPVTKFIFSRKPHTKLVNNIRADAQNGAAENS